MLNWKIIKINNKNSKFDFRLFDQGSNDYTKVDFSKYNMLRILVSLAAKLTDGIIFKEGFYKIISSSENSSIFDFSIIKSNPKSKFLTLDNSLNFITFNNNNEKIFLKSLSTKNTKIFQSMFLYEEVYNILKFVKKNIDAYSHVNKKNSYLVTGWINNSKSKERTNGSTSSIILDLLEFKNNKKTLIRCKIFDKEFINELDKTLKLHQKKLQSFCIFIVKFDLSNLNYPKIKLNYIIPITFDEYISYLYDLMLPYKYDFNDSIDDAKYIDYNKLNDIEKFAFAIDPDGSKDRDDAISCLYLKKNNNSEFNITDSKELASHIKLIVHISDTMQFIQPKNNNYYYHYSKYKCNTDYLDKLNLPLMDRILSENYLSLDGKNKKAITINLIYKIIDHEKFIINPQPEKVTFNRSKNLEIFGTTYYKFATSYGLNKEKNFDNNCFIKRKIISCNKNLIRDFNEFINEGKSSYSDKKLNLIANNLKQLYIFFVNSLNHTGKDTLIKLPSNLTRKNNNLYLDFSPIDMWAHSLIEYTALESNIYFAYCMYLQKSPNNLNLECNIQFNEIENINNQIGENNLELLINNITKKKKIDESKSGLFRNLYSPDKDHNYYLNKKIRNFINKISGGALKKNYRIIINKFLSYFKYDKDVNSFLKLILSLRQAFLLIEARTNLDISTKLISEDLKMKATYSFYPFAHYDICTFLYTHATSPMRRFIDINVHYLIFKPTSKSYILNKIDLEMVNSSINTGKYIKQLVNEYRFTEFIKINSKRKDLITKVQVLDMKNNSIGFIDLVNFFKFNSLFNLNNKINTVSLKLDNYKIPILKKENNKKAFNIFYHMLEKEDDKLKNKSKKFLEKIFTVKNIKEIC